MIDLISEYIAIQKRLVSELVKLDVDLWDCYQEDIFGWQCESHGEHICCKSHETGAQVELPLLTPDYVGIDAGHFIYYLDTIGETSPSYSEMNSILEALESDGTLVAVQKNKLPKVWNIKDNKAGSSKSLHASRSTLLDREPPETS